MSKFTLEHCPNGGTNCQALLIKINDLLENANYAIAVKDYRGAFNLEFTAFNNTLTLERKTCKKCTGMFRTVIMEKVEEHIEDLKRMTTGFLRKESYIPVLHQADALLNEMRYTHLSADETIIDLKYHVA